MNFNMEELKSKAASGDLAAKNKLSAIHMMGAFPGANPAEGLRLLEELAHKDNDAAAKVELGLHYFKGEKMERNTEQGLHLIEAGLHELGDAVPFEHCFEIGMMLTSIKGEDRQKVLKYQKLSKKLLEKALADTEGMKTLEQHMGQQAVMMVKGMLDAVNNYISTFE